MQVLIGMGFGMAGAWQQSVCHASRCVQCSMPDDGDARFGHARNGTNTPRVKLTAARAAFLHGA
ncbi:hypothetical protein [Caballeronia pedi]|uniref:hypothetical protein n=1 Tax=Caballeronia pedi TaxID=1777141 RepID=UPI001177C270|nr:hypothetical protein [Caballeronia pedi]